MTETKLIKLLAQGSLNYYSKHIKVICESEDRGNIFKVSIYCFVNKTLKDLRTIEKILLSELSLMCREIKDTVEETKVYLSL